MSDNIDNNNAGAQNAAPANNVDSKTVLSEIQNLGNEIRNTVKEAMTSFQPTIVNQAPATPAAQGIEDPEFKDAAEKLGLDADTFGALLSIINKTAQKNIMPVLNKNVDSKLTENALNAEITNDLISSYPDLARPTSPLFNQAKKEYEKLDNDIKNSPYAKKLAVYEAAKVLNIQPAAKNSAYNNMQATNPSGGGASAASDSKAEDEKLVSFASMFGLSEDKMKKGVSHWNNVKSKK